MNHIRIPFRRALRTTRNWAVVQDAEPRTLCGAPVTDTDISYNTAGTKKFRASGWPVCTECAKRRALDAQKVIL